MCRSEQKEFYAAKKRYAEMEEIKRRMDSLGHDGKWAVPPGNGKKGRLSEQVRIEAHLWHCIWRHFGWF
jgi:hypothetical protein